jgi:hypothetical protein
LNASFTSCSGKREQHPRQGSIAESSIGPAAAVERHNNTFKVNGTSAGLLPFDLQWAFNFGGDQVSFGADPSE